MPQDCRHSVRLRYQYPILPCSTTVDCAVRLHPLTGHFHGYYWSCGSYAVLTRLIWIRASVYLQDVSLVGTLITLSGGMTLMLTIPRLSYVCCFVSCFSVLAAYFYIMPSQRRRLTRFVTVARSFTARPQDLFYFPNQPNWSSGVNPCRWNRTFHLHLRTLPRTAAIRTAQV